MSKQHAMRLAADPEPKSESKTPPAPTLSADLLAKIRGAADLDAAVAVLAPAKMRTKRVDETFELNVNTTAAPPATRGAAGKVFAVAVRMNKTFTAQEIADALPDIKSARYQVRKLGKLGLLRVVEVGA